MRSRPPLLAREAFQLHAAIHRLHVHSQFLALYQRMLIEASFVIHPTYKRSECAW